MKYPVYRALPPYLGSKRHLAPLIFALLAEVLPQSEWRTSRLLDPMCGSGAMALTAKSYGFSVTAGDASPIGQVVARALIANSSTRVQRHHLLALLHGDAPADGPVREFVPEVFTPEQAVWLDRALAARARFADPLRALLELVIIRTALRLQPMSMLDGTDARHLATGDLDRISPRRLGHYLRANQALALPAVERLATDINAGIVGGPGQALAGDACGVIAATESDVLYLDPPYPGTTGYRDPYRSLRTLLGDAMTEEPPGLDELLDASAHIPLIVLSYGGRGVTLDSLTEIVSRRRRIERAVEIPYAHLQSLARKEHTDANREHIVIAR